MADSMETAIDELVQANSILLNNQVLDAFGHVSIRHPEIPERYLLPFALPPALVTAEDIVEFNLDSSPVEPTGIDLYVERYIHGSIYQARPDVNAVCHHHARAIMPFCITSTSLQAVSQTGASMGTRIPVWDSRAEFGDTNLLISNQQQADSLTRTLDDAWVVLMRQHGACAVGRNLRELVFRAVFTCHDAAIQINALALGEVAPLSTGELTLASQLRDKSINRCWDHWLAQAQTKGIS